MLVADGKIAAVGPRADTEIPAGAETIDATGKTIIPGLIDLHTHYAPFAPDTETAKRELGFQLAYGVTTARSIGLDTAETIAAIEKVRSGSAPGPRVFTAGRGFTAPGGVPMQNGLDQPRQPETPHGWGTQNEMRLLAEAGIEALDVIHMATGRAASRLGWTEFGTIESGAVRFQSQAVSTNRDR